MLVITQAVVLEAAPEEVVLVDVGLVEGKGREAWEETATILTRLEMMGHRWKLRHLQQRA